MRSVHVLILAVVITASAVMLTPDAASAGSRNWQTCTTCSAAPEVRLSGKPIKVEGSSVWIANRTVTLGVPGRASDDKQASSVHGVAVKLPPAKSYLIDLRWDLHTWDSYNASGSSPNSGSGYWDAFVTTVIQHPYWKSGVNDPLTTAWATTSVAMLWGGTSFGDKAKPEAANNKGRVRTIRMKGNAAKDNYLNIILDTVSKQSADGVYPSWGTVTIQRIRKGGVNVANPKIGVPFKYGKWAISNGYRSWGDHAPGGNTNSHTMLALDLQKCAAFDANDICTKYVNSDNQKVVSPVTGRVKYVKRDGNCVRGVIVDIDGAPGYRMSLYHVQPSPGLVVGSRVKRGTGRKKNDGSFTPHIGTVSPLSGDACGSANHIHMALYFVPPMSQGDWGRQHRIGIPFDRRWVIGDGCALPDNGKTYAGLQVPCSKSAASQAPKVSQIRPSRRR